MTLQHMIGSFRIYGFRGCIDHLKRIFCRHEDIAKWQKYLITDKEYVPAPGITIIGTLSDSGSLNKVLRDFCINLKRARIPFQAFDLECNNPIPESEYRSLLTPLEEFKLNRYSDIIGMNTLPPFPKIQCRQSRISYWEFESGLCEVHPEATEPGTVIANSVFNKSVFGKLLPSHIKIEYILYPFQFLAINIPSRDSVRRKYGINPSDFMVFYNFDFSSGYYRKNPEGAILAFKKAFSSHTNVKLVFKTNHATRCPKYLNRLQKLIRDNELDDKVIFINQFLSQEDLVGLTNACDAYLSLHRGEGFGLGIAEAMSLGKPVVVTNYSAPTEFCNANNSMLIPYKMVPVQNYQRDTWYYTHVDFWAEPNLDAAAQALAKLYDDRDFARQIGEKGKASITQQFSIENFKYSIDSFLARQ